MSKIILSKTYYPALNNQNRYMLLYGGAGSGKSEFAVRKIIYRLITEQQEHRIAVIRKYKRTNRLSTVEVFKSALENLEIAYKHNKTDLDITTIINNYKHRIYFLGLDDPEKLKSIKGITSVWIEEATEIREEDFLQVDLRLREPTKTYKQIILTFNPVLSKARWLYEMFFEKEHDDTYILHTTILDNPIEEVRQNYLRILENIEDPTYRKIYKEGLWAELGNLIYPNYQVISDMPALLSERCSYGLDFGFNNPAVLVKICFDGSTIFVQELFYQSHLTVSDLISLVKNKATENDKMLIYADIEPTIIAEMKSAGIRIQTKKPKSVFESILKLKKYSIKITDDSPNVIKEIQEYKWKEDKNGAVLDEPVKFRDHAMDAMRYAFCGKFGHIGEGKIFTKMGHRGKKTW